MGMLSPHIQRCKGSHITFFTPPSHFICVFFFLQVLSVQMCDVVNEIEQEKERCEVSTSGNVTSGNISEPFFTLTVCRRLFTRNKRL